MPYTLSASFWGEIPKWLATLLMSICQIIDQIIYSLINWMYRVFILISEVDIFKDGTQIQAIANRMYIIVGIAMLFIFAYNIVLLIINPEGKQLGNMAKVVQNAIISVILIIFLPLIFTYLKTVQNHIVTQNVIGNIVLGSTVDDNNTSQKNTQAGVKASLDIYSAFYHPVNESYSSCKLKCCPSGTENCDGKACKDDICYDYVNAYNDAYENANITDFIWKKELRDGVKDGKVEYLGLVSALAGGFALWMFISFALDIGIRVGKMAFYEIISPIPVMMRILPGDKMFDKWFKGLKDTYLSIFIRLIVIYTCMYFVTLVPELMANLTSPSGADGALIVALANVIIILGILQFAKDAPKLISDMFGGGAGGLKFGIRKKLADNPINTPLDMIRSGVYAANYGKTTYTDENGIEHTVDTGGFFRGAWRGRKGYKQGVATTNELIARKQSGATLGDILKDKAKTAVGLMTDYDAREFKVKADLAKEGIEVMKENNKELKDQIDKLNNTINNSIEKQTSKIKSAATGSIGVDKDGHAIAGTIISSTSGNRYSLNGKNYTQMQQVYEDAVRNREDAATVNAIRESIQKWKTVQTNGMKDTVLAGNAHTISEIGESVQLTLDYASKDIKNHIEKNGVSVFNDSDKQWEDAIEKAVRDKVKGSENLKEVKNAKALKDISDILEKADVQISHREATIKNANKEGYRAKKGSSDWVKRDSGSNGKK